MRRVRVVGAGWAMVDDEDYERVARIRWISQKGYPATGKKGGHGGLYLHRLVMRAAAGVDVDHANGNTMDARKANLRFCNDSQNQANRRRIQGRIPIKGVCIHKQSGKYQAQVKKDGRNHYLGLYTNRYEAGRAYIRKARELFGDFAWSNVRDDDDQGQAA